MEAQEDYELIPMSEITDEARELAVAWMECDDKNWIGQKHKLASDIMNYAKKYHASLEQQIDSKEIPAGAEEILLNKQIAISHDFDGLMYGAKKHEVIEAMEEYATLKVKESQSTPAIAEGKGLPTDEEVNDEAERLEEREDCNKQKYIDGNYFEGFVDCWKWLRDKLNR